ncbi:MAG: DUF2332 family protein [Paracoccaceae bacterium]
MITITDAFNAQVDACENLGSPFTATLLRLMADNLGDDHPVGAFLHGWPSLETFRSGAVALRLAGALNSLVLLGKDPSLSAVYPPNSPANAALWQAVDQAMRKHSTHLIDWMTSAPQTNEIRRSNALIPAFHLIAQETRLPFILSEIGASAGLNLNWDRYAMELGGQIWGPKDASVRLTPDWRGPLPLRSKIEILTREGCDLMPLDPADKHDCLRMMSYIWPDQTQRIENTRRALELAAETAHMVHKEDALNFLKHRLKVQKGATRVIYHTIMWQYLPEADQAKGAAMIRDAGACATPDAPLAWLRVEADQKKAGGAPITLNIWPDGKTRHLGRADFHGRWVQWN